MKPTSVQRVGGVLCTLMLTAAVAGAADDPRATTPGSRPAASVSGRPGAVRGGTAKGMLPDPVLLDGSTLQAEKKSETGMIGDFELPGDENAKSGKMGGQQNPNSPSAGGQASSTPPGGLPQGAGGPQGQQAQAGGAQGPEGSPPSGGGAQGAGPQNPNAAGNPVAGAGDPGAKPEGVQVAELGGDASGKPQGLGVGGTGEKPKQVAIGDSAMRIEQSAAGAGVVGAQPQQVAGHTQQHEKGTGSGGKGAGGAASGNRVEKGRAIPSGL